MPIRITKVRVAMAALFVLAGVGLASLLGPLTGSALATAGQIVNVSDPVNANTARVDASGKLNVGDGSGALSVDGTVAARPAPPASPWRASEDIQAGAFIAGPSAAPINVTSISISTDAATGSNADTFLYGMTVPASATSCAGATGYLTLWHIRDLGDGVTPVSFSFPTPMQYKPPANTKACLWALAHSGGSVTTMNAVGFYGG